MKKPKQKKIHPFIHANEKILQTRTNNHTRERKREREKNYTFFFSLRFISRKSISEDLYTLSIHIRLASIIIIIIIYTLYIDKLLFGKFSHNSFLREDLRQKE